MKLIIGLGNPGGKFTGTRHNIGFMIADKLARELAFGIPQWKNDSLAHADTCRFGDVLLVKPQTFMNQSGSTVKTLIKHHKAQPEDVWVIHDDIDLPLGKIRIRKSGGSAGHNGVASIMAHIGTDSFIRFRMGVGRGMITKGRTMDRNWNHRAVIGFVLSRFGQSEAGKSKHLVKNGVAAVRLALAKGIDVAANRMN